MKKMISVMAAVISVLGVCAAVCCLLKKCGKLPCGKIGKEGTEA